MDMSTETLILLAVATVLVVVYVINRIVERNRYRTINDTQQLVQDMHSTIERLHDSVEMISDDTLEMTLERRKTAEHQAVEAKRLSTPALAMPRPQAGEIYDWNTHGL